MKFKLLNRQERQERGENQIQTQQKMNLDSRFCFFLAFLAVNVFDLAFDANV